MTRVETLGRKAAVKWSRRAKGHLAGGRLPLNPVSVSSLTSLDAGKCDTVKLKVTPRTELYFPAQERSNCEMMRSSFSSLFFFSSLHPGKDLSSRTETDLNCIFGKRAKPTKAKEQVSRNVVFRDLSGVTLH